MMLTPQERAELRFEHEQIDAHENDAGWCNDEDQPWPCTIIRLLDTIDALEKERDAARVQGDSAEGVVDFVRAMMAQARLDKVTMLPPGAIVQIVDRIDAHFGWNHSDDKWLAELRRMDTAGGRPIAM